MYWLFKNLKNLLFIKTLKCLTKKNPKNTLCKIAPEDRFVKIASVHMFSWKSLMYYKWKNPSSIRNLTKDASIANLTFRVENSWHAIFSSRQVYRMRTTTHFVLWTDRIKIKQRRTGKNRTNKQNNAPSLMKFYYLIFEVEKEKTLLPSLDLWHKLRTDYNWGSRVHTCPIFTTCFSFKIRFK